MVAEGLVTSHPLRAGDSSPWSPSSTASVLRCSQAQVHPATPQVPGSSASGHLCEGADLAAGIKAALKKQCFLMFTIKPLKQQIYKPPVISVQKY